MDITNRKRIGADSAKRVREIGDMYKGFVSVQAVRDEYGVKCNNCAFLLQPDCQLVSCHHSEDDNGNEGNVDIVWIDGNNE